MGITIDPWSAPIQTRISPGAAGTDGGFNLIQPATYHHARQVAISAAMPCCHADVCSVQFMITTQLGEEIILSKAIARG